MSSELTLPDGQRWRKMARKWNVWQANISSFTDLFGWLKVEILLPSKWARRPLQLQCAVGKRNEPREWVMVIVFCLRVVEFRRVWASARYCCCRFPRISFLVAPGPNRIWEKNQQDTPSLSHWWWERINSQSGSLLHSFDKQTTRTTVATVHDIFGCSSQLVYSFYSIWTRIDKHLRKW